jgi:hypothetical protein
VGAKVTGGTTLEFRFDKRFDIAGDFMVIRLGHKRIRNLDGLIEWLCMIDVLPPEEWLTLDCSPERHIFADCLRNVLGHDLTLVKTAKGAERKRFPVKMNLAAIENFMIAHGMQGELRRCYMVKDGMAYIGIQLRDRTLWEKAIRDDGSLDPGAIAEAVDALKKLPTMRIVGGEFVPFAEFVS